jgi:hypothetical protein
MRKIREIDIQGIDYLPNKRLITVSYAAFYF